MHKMSGLCPNVFVCCLTNFLAWTFGQRECGGDSGGGCGGGGGGGGGDGGWFGVCMGQ